MRATLSITAIAVLVLIVFGSTAAPAENVRSFVSATNGSDNNPCTRVEPCRSFQTAYANTAVGGEINTLDPGGYGPLTIDHSISIVSGLGEAGVLVPAGQAGITITAGPTDKVHLRGLIIEGAGVGQSGVAFFSGGTLGIENCVVRNLTSSGLAFSPTGSSTITVSNTLVRDNGGHGVYVQPSGSALQVFALFNHVEAYSNSLEGIGVYGNSLSADANLFATAVDSVSANNADGYYVVGNNANPTALFKVSRSVASGNIKYGVFADAGSSMSISQVNFGLNGQGSANVVGRLFSGGDNNIMEDNSLPIGTVKVLSQ